MNPELQSKSLKKFVTRKKNLRNPYALYKQTLYAEKLNITCSRTTSGGEYIAAYFSRGGG